MNSKVKLNVFVTAPSNPGDKRQQVTQIHRKNSFYLFLDDYAPQVKQSGVKDYCSSFHQNGLNQQ
jgi:hypothetical protein